jgi:predicted 2-oxoglutarate/Fe(II)-dependent dioxygenase YbiX/peroxiredoxin
MASYINLQSGDPAPWFHARTGSSARFAFDAAAGRHIALCFFATAADARSKAAIDAALARPDLFNDARAAFFGVSVDPADEAQMRIPERTPGYRFFHDHDGGVSRMFGSLPQGAGEGTLEARRFWLILDPALRVVAQFPFDAHGEADKAAISALEAAIRDYEKPGAHADAPVLLLPRVFDAAFCAELIALYETKGGTDSGFMREVEGKTVGVYDYAHKRRRDYNIEEDAVIKRAQALVRRRIVPEIKKAHQFDVTRMERYIVACYDAAEEAHFRPHRDNTTSGTAHRRFACSILLNGDYEGGDLSFPEYGSKRWRPPAGGAVVFSCSILHTVSKVTKGRRYAFLPFLYDEAAARLREANNAKLSDEIAPYRAGAGASA